MVAPRSRLAAVLAVGLLLPVALAAPAHAAASVSWAELSGSQMRIEGTALANRRIVDSAGSTATQQFTYHDPAVRGRTSSGAASRLVAQRSRGRGSRPDRGLRRPP